jgi:hypothetical protein
MDVTSGRLGVTGFPMAVTVLAPLHTIARSVRVLFAICGSMLDIAFVGPAGTLYTTSRGQVSSQMTSSPVTSTTQLRVLLSRTQVPFSPFMCYVVLIVVPSSC